MHGLSLRCCLHGLSRCGASRCRLYGLSRCCLSSGRIRIRVYSPVDYRVKVYFGFGFLCDLCIVSVSEITEIFCPHCRTSCNLCETQPVSDSPSRKSLKQCRRTLSVNPELSALLKWCRVKRDNRIPIPPGSRARRDSYLSIPACQHKLVIIPSRSETQHSPQVLNRDAENRVLFDRGDCPDAVLPPEKHGIRKS